MLGKLMHLMNNENVNVLMGKTLSNVQNKDNEEIIFQTTEDEIYKMYHEQDCCESVTVEEIIGDLNDLIGTPITMAEEVTQEGKETDWGTSTWTFYKFATNKGYVTIRWLGESNGYYSESVTFEKVENEEE